MKRFGFGKKDEHHPMSPFGKKEGQTSMSPEEIQKEVMSDSIQAKE